MIVITSIMQQNYMYGIVPRWAVTTYREVIQGEPLNKHCSSIRVNNYLASSYLWIHFVNSST